MEEEEEQSKEAGKSLTSSFWKSTTTFQKVMLVFIIVFPFYIASTTALVPNCQNAENLTGGTTDQCMVLYDYGDSVPKDFMSNGQAAILVIVTLVLFFSLFQQTRKGRITVVEAIKIVKKELNEIKSLPTLDGGSIYIKDYNVEIPTGVITRSRKEKGVWKPFRYYIGMVLHNKKDDVPNYYRAMVNPMTSFFDGFVPSSTDIIDSDMCSHCGKHYDVRDVMGDFNDLKKLMEIGGAKNRK